MKLRDICNKLEEWAPLAYQESYDNSGLIVGDPETDVKGVLVVWIVWSVSLMKRLVKIVMLLYLTIQLFLLV